LPLIGPSMTQGASIRSQPQGSQEGQRAPVPVRHLGDQPAAAGAAAMAARHVGLGPGLVDKDQSGGVEPALMRLPAPPPPGDVRPVLLAGVQGFF
jgi:hypothetical protein